MDNYQLSNYQFLLKAKKGKKRKSPHFSKNLKFHNQTHKKKGKSKGSLGQNEKSNCEILSKTLRPRKERKEKVCISQKI